MGVLIGPETRVLCQGMTGRMGTFHSERMIAYGTKLVGGVRPGKGGKRHLNLPLFDTVAEGMEATGADASAVFVPPDNAAAAMIEAIEAEMPLVVCVTERVPVLDMVRVRHALAGSKTRLVGPNSQGVLAPGACKIGVMPSIHERPGRIGIVSRSASLTSEVIEQTSRLKLGQSTTVGVGGDPVHGLSLAAVLELFLADPGTDGIILIGEIGGAEEEEAADFLRNAKPNKPVVGFVAGRHAPKRRRMGHAGTLNVVGGGDAESKTEALRRANVFIAPDAATIGETMHRAL
ncbi:MAG TPA: succinate--CoA ligase subunit alpha [Hyphomicrobiales bacterium]|nr:succinate--CoA ligase subunit alpha [Hyphomicrobiales bacterium]